MDILQEEQKITFANEYPVLAITVDGEPVSKLSYDDKIVWEPTSNDYFYFTEIDTDECELTWATTENLPEKVVIPAIYNGRKVTAIWGNAFSRHSGMRHLYIPHTVRSIGAEAFRECPDLQEVILPHNSELEELGDSVFRNSDNLSRINLENATKLKTIPSGAFRGCGGLYDIILPPNLETIENGAFFWSGIGRVTFPKTLQTIGAFAFCCCPSFMTPLIPKAVTDVGFWAFALTFTDELRCEAENRPGGWSLFWSDLMGRAGADWNITGDSPFSFKYSDDYDCEVFAGDPDYVNGELVLPNEGVGGRYEGEPVVAVADWGFSNYSDLTGINTGDTIEHIGNYAFAGCTGIKTLTFGTNVTTIGNYAFSGCESITEVVIPSGVTSIGDGAFEGCTSLASVTIPNSIEFIGRDAFNNCSKSLLVVCDKLEAENPFTPHVHTWSEWEQVKAPSCSEAGIRKRTCTSCNRAESENISRLDHNWDDGDVIVEATCATEGSRQCTCQVCGKTGSISIPATGQHDYESIYSESTATENGKWVYTCSCGDSYDVVNEDDLAKGYAIKLTNGKSDSLPQFNYAFPISGTIPERIYKNESFSFTVGTCKQINSNRFGTPPNITVDGAERTISLDNSGTTNMVDDIVHVTIYEPHATVEITLG